MVAPFIRSLNPDTNDRNSEEDSTQIPSDFREKFITNLTNLMESDAFLNESRINFNSKSFTRQRKFPFSFLLVFLLRGLTRSLSSEISDFFLKISDTAFKDFTLCKSAISHSRKKLQPECFKVLHSYAVKTFYSETEYLKWQGYRLLSVDGTTLALPRHPSILKEFGEEMRGNTGSKQHPMARASLLFDSLNNVTINAEIDSYKTSERELFVRHLPYINPGKDLLILDRGYPAYELFYKLQCMKIDYCIRLTERFGPVKKMLEANQEDEVFHLKFKDINHAPLYLKKTDEELFVRIVIIKLPNKSFKILCSSLTDQDKISHEALNNLYHRRWPVEENFKLLKARVSIQHFSSKTAVGVKQDFYSKVFLMTLTAILSFPVEQKIKKDPGKKRRKHSCQINKTNAIQEFRHMAVQLFIKKIVRPILKIFDKILATRVEIVRPGRSVLRSKVKIGPPPAMAYKPF